MPIKLACVNHTSLVLPGGFCRRLPRVFNFIEAATNKFFAEVNVIMVEAKEMRRLNQVYRFHWQITDVLSFVYNPAPTSGEIIICLEQAVRQAARYGEPLTRELIRLAIHGALHLLGYDHIKVQQRQVMRAMETELLNRLRCKNTSRC